MREGVLLRLVSSATAVVSSEEAMPMVWRSRVKSQVLIAMVVEEVGGWSDEEPRRQYIRACPGTRRQLSVQGS